MLKLEIFEATTALPHARPKQGMQDFFEKNLTMLRQEGVEVVRRAFDQDLEAFEAEPLVKKHLEEHGLEALPMVLVEGRCLAFGRWPKRVEMLRALGLPSTHILPSTSARPAAFCCGRGCQGCLRHYG